MSLGHAFKWSFLSELAAKAIQPVVFIVLARILSPEDFGVIAAATMVIAFSQIFWEAGMANAVIQRQTKIEASANAAFWINITLGIFISSLLFVFADQIASTLSHDGRVNAVLKVMTLQIILGAFSSVQTAMLQKEMGFKKLFWVRFASVSIPGIASVPLAFYGWGIWALVIGTLCGQLSQVVMLWRLSHWKPKLQFSNQVAREISKFGALVSATSLVTWFFAWGDTFVIGHFLGMHNLGLYRTGNQFSDLIFVSIFSPILPVLYSHLSRLSGDTKSMSFLIENLLKLIMWISFPIGAFLFIFGGSIEKVIFGPKWVGLGVVISYLSLRQSFAWISSLNAEVYKALGKPHYELIILLASLLIYAPTYFILAKIDLVAFVYGRLLLVLLSMAGHMWLISVVLKLPMRPLYSYGCLLIIVSFAFTMLGNYFATILNMSELLKMLSTLLLGTLSLLSIFIFLRQHKILNNLRVGFRSF